MRQAAVSWRRVEVALAGLLLAGATITVCHAAIPGLPIAQPELTAQSALFPEALVPTKVTTAAEDNALLDAVIRYQASATADNFTPLETFLAQHANSGWNAALLTNLGLLYFHSGYLSKAIGAFQQAWTDGSSATETHAKAMVDRAVGELLFLQARLGDPATLQTDLTEIGTRSLSGPATEMLVAARQVLANHLQPPAVASLSGPPPLKTLLLAAGAPPATAGFLNLYRSTTVQPTLAQLGQIATQAGIAHRLIYRAAGSAVPVPSVVHWKIDHFAALVGSSAGHYSVIDPAFGQTPRQITDLALEAESSGFFLVSGTQAAPGWRNATAGEANQVFGYGLNR